MSNNDPVRLTATKSDAEKATEYKQALGEKLAEACSIITAAKRDGIIIQFQIGTDALGKSFVGDLKALREL